MIRRVLSVCAAAAVAATALAVSAPANVASDTPLNQGGTSLVLTEKNRLQGDDRYATAVAASRSAYPGTVNTVYLASGLNFPDALSAGPIAANQGAPLLLTTPWGLPSPVRAELQRLKPERIVLVGGTSSISPSVERAVAPLATTVVRRPGPIATPPRGRWPDEPFRGGLRPSTWRPPSTSPTRSPRERPLPGTARPCCSSTALPVPSTRRSSRSSSG